MKGITLALLLFVASALLAQKPLFVRVYDGHGKKIEKGHVMMVTDSLLQLKLNTLEAGVPVQNIGFIKTGRSDGHNILTGAIIGTSLGVILGVATADPDAWILPYTAGEGAAMFGLGGAIQGALIGLITLLGKKEKTFEIHGDFEKWKTFQQMIEERKKK